MRRLGGALLACIVAACGTNAPCDDADLDGYGSHCPLGPDCDPNNAERNVDCTNVAPPDCASDPTLTGCPCLPASLQSCLLARAGVGECTAGRTTCVNGFWGRCEGGRAPSIERCDQRDEDCDGAVDEGVLSPCGACTPGCRGAVWGEGREAFEANDDLELTARGELTLRTIEQTFDTVWAANSAEGTLSAIDTASAIERARYWSGGREPSRVAVDWLGDAWVVNREFEGTASVRAIATAPARCIDRDGDGVETSTGPTDLRADDECVRVHAEVGRPRAVARAIAIDGDRGADDAGGGDPWVGLHDAEAIVEIDGATGAARTVIETPGFSPYAATFDRWGTLWMIERDGLLARIDLRESPPSFEPIEVPFACYLLYGIAADREGRLLLTGFGCDRVIAYDPSTGRWDSRPTPASPRGVAFDGASSFWVAHTGASVSEITIDPLRVRRTLPLATAELAPFETIGAAVDGLGNVWAISSAGASGENGVATRVDPTRGEVTAQVAIGRGPHVQGDLTGSRVRVRPVTHGMQQRVFTGCGPEIETEWKALHVRGDAGSRGQIEFAVRRANDVEALGDAVFVDVGALPEGRGPFDLTRFAQGGVLEVRVTLRIDAYLGAPRLGRLGVEWNCPGPE